MEAVCQFEKEWAAWSNTSNVVACSSGTSALHLALEALRLPPDSEVLTSDYSMVAVPRAIVTAGLVPVFVDCTDDLLIDAAMLPKGLSHKTKAILPVHVYGRQCDMTGISALAEMAHLYVVEDLAEAHGVVPHLKSHAAAWSMYKNKIVCATDAEGGCVAFRDPEHARLARSLRCLGFGAAHDYTHIPRGWNHRLSNAHAQLIRKSLAEVEDNIRQRRTIEGWYDRYCPDEWKMPRRDTVWVYDLHIPGMTSKQQTRVVHSLQANGIAARYGFKPMSQQEEFKNCRVIGNGNAARMASEVFYLPVQPGITTEGQAERSFDLIRRSL